jgi:hypothetical protein
MQRPLQRVQGPSGGSVLFSVGLTLELGQNPLAFFHPIFDRRAASVARLDSSQPLPVEARYQLRNGIARTTTGRSGRLGVAHTVCYSQKRLGSCYMAGRVALRTTDPLQDFALFGIERTQRIFLSTGHGRTPSDQDVLDYTRHYTPVCSKRQRS